MIRKISGFILSLLLANTLSWAQSAQKVHLVDMEYILSKVPAYLKMNEKLEAQSQMWQNEVKKLEAEASKLYEKFQNDISRLTLEQRRTSEEAIIAKEKAAYELKRKYFAPDGELAKRREAQMKPIQSEVWNSIKELALTNGIQIIIDKSTGKIVYADPAADLSPYVVQKMGYQN